MKNVQVFLKDQPVNVIEGDEVTINNEMLLIIEKGGEVVAVFNQWVGYMIIYVSK